MCNIKIKPWIFQLGSIPLLIPQGEKKIIANATHGILKCGKHYRNEKNPVLQMLNYAPILGYSNHKQQATMWMDNLRIIHGNNRS